MFQNSPKSFNILLFVQYENVLKTVRISPVHKPKKKPYDAADQILDKVPGPGQNEQIHIATTKVQYRRTASIFLARWLHVDFIILTL